MTAHSRERGSHAGPSPHYRLPFAVPGLSGRGTLDPVRPGGCARRP